MRPPREEVRADAYPDYRIPNQDLRVVSGMANPRKASVALKSRRPGLTTEAVLAYNIRRLSNVCKWLHYVVRCTSVTRPC